MNLGSQDCLMAFIRSPSNSAAVGHWLSLLLKVRSCPIFKIGNFSDSNFGKMKNTKN